MTKLIVEAETSKVLGASMCRPDAAKIMQVRRTLKLPSTMIHYCDDYNEFISDIGTMMCRKILFYNGIEQLIRRAKQTHKNFKAAATDALRDLGLDNYNS